MYSGTRSSRNVHEDSRFREIILYYVNGRGSVERERCLSINPPLLRGGLDFMRNNWWKARRRTSLMPTREDPRNPIEEIRCNGSRKARQRDYRARMESSRYTAGSNVKSYSWETDDNTRGASIVSTTLTESSVSTHLPTSLRPHN